MNYEYQEYKSSGILRHLVWQMCTKVMEEPAVSIIYPEDEDVWVLRNVGIRILDLRFPKWEP
jgi:hypothetical protein